VEMQEDGSEKYFNFCIWLENIFTSTPSRISQVSLM
jgi:hypothetical protein